MKFIKFLFFCISFVLFSISANAQTDMTISGTVTDDSGLPVPGATIMIKGTKNAVSSDIDGNYQIKANSQATLVYSYIGFTTKEEVVKGRTTINTRIYADTQSLEEVVVVGYGTQKKSVVTGSISGVKAKDLEDLPITRVEQSLQGRVSGVTIAMNSGQPGSSSHIRVRGTTTFNGESKANDPLYVVDGLTVDNIDFLNQADVESIEVLKDAASQAIYGTRASTGVILITTKKGKSGKITVSYTGTTGLAAPAKKLDLLNATQYATLLNESYVADNKPLQFNDPSAEGVGTDWQDAIFNKSAKKELHEVSVSGGSESSTFFFSFALLDHEGVVMTDISNFNRKNIRLNSVHKISKWLTVGQTAGYSNEKTVGIGNTNSEFGGPLASAINLDPTTPLVETDPTILATNANYQKANIVRDANGNPYGISSLVTQELANPFAYAHTRLGNYNWADNFVGNAYAEISPIDGLKIRSTWGTKLSYYGGESFTPQFYLSSAYIGLKNNVSTNKNKALGWSIENTATYTKQLDKHNFSLLIGQGTYVENIGGGNGITKAGIPTNDYRQASINFEVPLADVTAYGYTNPEHRITSLFSRLNYDFNEKYLLSAVIRRDGSNKFGANHKYGNFPSFSLGWVASKEAFWPENNYINQLKFRGGYGVTGNDNNLKPFRYESLVAGGSNYTVGDDGSVVVGSNPQAPPNPGLKWEETNQANMAIDMTLLRNVNLSVDFFRKRTVGILQPVKLPGYVGNLADPYGNVATMENKGFEIELGYQKRFGEFSVNLSGNVSYLNNEVISLGKGVKFLSGGETVQSSTFPITRVEVGHPYNAFYGYQTQGIFQNQAEIDAYANSDGALIQPGAKPGDFRWKDSNGDGKITDADRTFIGDPNPNYIYGFTANFAYKGFDLLVFGQGVAGNQIYQGLRRLDVSNANWQSEALNRWTGEGTSNTYPRLTQNDTNKNFSNPSDFYIEDGDYLRIKTIQLGYSLPSDVIATAGLSKVRIYVTGENVFTFTKYTGYDPEIGGTTLGIDRGYYPQAKTFMLGVNLQF